MQFLCDYNSRGVVTCALIRLNLKSLISLHIANYVDTKRIFDAMQINSLILTQLRHLCIYYDIQTENTSDESIPNLCFVTPKLKILSITLEHLTGTEIDENAFFDLINDLDVLSLKKIYINIGNGTMERACELMISLINCLLSHKFLKRMDKPIEVIVHLGSIYEDDELSELIAKKLWDSWIGFKQFLKINSNFLRFFVWDSNESLMVEVLDEKNCCSFCWEGYTGNTCSSLKKLNENWCPSCDPIVNSAYIESNVRPNWRQYQF